MKERRADTAQAWGLALLLHALVFALMFLGLWWTRSAAPVSAAGAPVEAELVDASALSASMREVLSDRPEPLPEPEPEPLPEPEQSPPPQPEPEPVPEDSPTPPQRQAQEQLVEPDDKSQDEVVAEPTPTPAEEQELQERKQRQAQVDLTERKRQEEAERKRRLAQMEQQRQKQLAEIRRRREAAAREAELAEQRLEQIAQARARTASEEAASADAAASAPAGNNGVDAGLKARYAAALQEAIESKWVRPETVPIGARCTLVIRQLPGGEVMSAEVSSPCAYDEAGRRSIEAAVLKAQPLPYAGFEQVFSRTLTLNFVARD